jgi:hypothetical protein
MNFFIALFPFHKSGSDNPGLPRGIVQAIKICRNRRQVSLVPSSRRSEHGLLKVARRSISQHAGRVQLDELSASQYGYQLSKEMHTFAESHGYPRRSARDNVSV